jgi:predicted transcriptional regulator
MSWGGSRQKLSEELKQEIIDTYIREKIPPGILARKFNISYVACYELVSTLEEYKPWVREGLSEDKVNELRRLYANNEMKVNDITKKFNISNRVFYKYVNDLKGKHRRVVV